MGFERQLKNTHRQRTRNISELGLVQSCLLAIRDIAGWLILEWRLEENQGIAGLLVAKIGVIGAILFLLWVLTLVAFFVWAQLVS